MLLYWQLAVAVVMLLMTDACNRTPKHQCSCRYLPKFRGCFIVEAAPPGFKCECRYFVRNCRTPFCSDSSEGCSGFAHPCRNDEACPGGRYSPCSCVQGGGNCKGYLLRPSIVKNCPKVNKVEASSVLKQYSFKDCDCESFSNRGGAYGCRIVKAASEGFKCLCQIHHWQGCTGQSIGCNEDEHCPANDYTYCGCRREDRSNCDGYRHSDRDQVCNFGSTCNCNRSSDWTIGRYHIAETIFKTDASIQGPPTPVEIGHELDLPNASDLEQSQRMTVVNVMKSESSFERTHGLTVEVGIEFLAITPTVSLTSSTTQTFQFGKKTTTSNQTSLSYTCKSPPKTHTRCTIFLMSSDMTVPYTMLLKSNANPDCTCRSFGNWKSTTTYFSQMVAATIGPCHRLVSGKCVTQ